MSVDVWAIGALYEPYVGRWSRLVAVEFLSWIAVPPGSQWLDVGCGTGAVTAAILARSEPAGVTGIDPSSEFVAHARAAVSDPRARFDVGDAVALPYRASQFDAAVTGLVLNFVPDPGRMATELVRVTRSGGTVAGYVWDYAGRMQLMRYFWDAATELDPAAEALAEGSRFPICQPEPLFELFDAAGLAEVDVQPIEIPTRFRDFDDYWTPFLGGQGPAPAYTMSLSEPARAELRELLRARLP
ncbi:MAG: class I SAM-dependent methyltransferase, partial [Sporichthyaceae bacterium]|nr:class I SAM-dependent methyltransferase [Sporichthyaceae bacterium]